MCINLFNKDNECRKRMLCRDIQEDVEHEQEANAAACSAKSATAIELACLALLDWHGLHSALVGCSCRHDAVCSGYFQLQKVRVRRLTFNLGLAQPMSVNFWRLARASAHLDVACASQERNCPQLKRQYPPGNGFGGTAYRMLIVFSTFLIPRPLPPCPSPRNVLRVCYDAYTRTQATTLPGSTSCSTWQKR